MAWMRGMLGVVAIAVVPPTAPGPWHQLGAAPTSRPGKALHFFRTARDPHALAIVATSKASRPIRVSWSTYCEFESDDGITEEHQGVVRGVRRVTVYPSVFAGATLCYVSVNVTPPTKTAAVAAAAFDS